MKQRYKAVVSYDGTDFAGWQVQPRKRSVQAEIERALQQILQEQIRLHASGRTDTGVHARAQVIHFDVSRPLELVEVRRSLNAVLDSAVRVTSLHKARPRFHARIDALSKQYRYFIWNDDIAPPTLRLYRTHVRQKLDLDSMQQAAALLVGRHDFASFSANPRREMESTVRDLSTLKLSKRGHELVIQAEANGFLYKMVRSLAGCLIHVGLGKLDPAEIPELLAAKKRTRRIPTAPAKGLFLWSVQY